MLHLEERLKKTLRHITFVLDCLQRELQHDDEYAMRQRREHTQEVVALFCNSVPHPEVKS